MALLEFLEGLYELYLIFIDSPLVVWRWIKRWRHPTEAERAAAGTR